jgi:tetratricopeptide (TPR) repeat protein
LKDRRHYMQVGRAIGRQDFAGAAVSCTEILAKAPRDGFAMAMLGQCYSAMGQTREALAAADQALERLPNSFDTLRLATDLSVRLNEHSRARGYASRALAAATGRHSVPPLALRLIRLAARMPVLRRAFRPDRLAEFEPGGHAHDTDAWQRWAREYVNAGATDSKLVVESR